MRAMMGSVILCADPGAATGEMLFAYPSTSLSSDKEIETMKCPLRVYMGCAVYQPENLLRLPHVSFEGLVSGHTMKESDLIGEGATGDFGKLNTLDDVIDPDKAEDKNEFIATLKKQLDIDMTDDEMTAYLKRPMYEGAVWKRRKGDKGSAGWVLHTKNTGHLGVLDDPEQCDRLHGMHKFSVSAVRV
jgi:hypothetical protein